MGILYFVGAVLVVFILLKIILKTIKTALIITLLGGIGILWWMMQQGMFK